MDTFDYAALGRRLKALRRRKRINQQEMADLLGKSLRTVQKYESGEIEVSIDIIHQVADILETTPMFLLGYEAKCDPIRTMADVMSFLFELENVEGLDFSIEVKKPPRNPEWTGSICFNGKAPEAGLNADMCLFLDQWEDERDDVRTFHSSQSGYSDWKEQNLAYYAATPVKVSKPKELDSEERIEKRNEYLAKKHGKRE